LHIARPAFRKRLYNLLRMMYVIIFFLPFFYTSYYHEAYYSNRFRGEENVARITVEDCLERVDNRFTLVHLAARRVRQLKKGAPPLLKCKNREVVTALREIAAGLITPETLKDIDEEMMKTHELLVEPEEELEE